MIRGLPLAVALLFLFLLGFLLGVLLVILSMSHVRKSFAGLQAVDDLSFSVEKGECLGLLGPNGAGKTTTLRLSLGLSRADSGLVNLLGFNMADDPYEARARVGVVPQQDALDPDFSVRENLLVFGRYFGLNRSELEARIPELLSFASLEKRGADRVTDLSGGLKRRLTLARALINDPEMIFLDEPTTALDPQARHLIWERLQSLREQGKTLLLTTHFMDEAQRLCDRILIIDQGRAIASGTPRNLIREQIDSEVIELFGRSAKAWLESHQPDDGTARVEFSGDTVFVYTKQARSWLALLEEDRGDLQYLYRPANLEDVFLRLTGRDLRDD